MASYTQDPTEDTGIRDLTPRGNSEVSRARERKANAALKMALDGESWDDIAIAVGYPDGGRAQAAVELALEKGVFTEDSQKILRRMASKKLERLERAVWKSAIDPDDPNQFVAHGRALSVLDRWIKLHGLDAPTQHIVSSPAESKIEEWVAQVINAGQPALEEPDIFELPASEYSEVT